MSTTGSKRATPTPFHTLESFGYVVTHVFFPVELPKENNYSIENDLSLAGAVCAAACAYTPHVRGSFEEHIWGRITNMLDNLRVSIQSGSMDKDRTISQLRGMETGDITAFFIRSENAAVVFTKRKDNTLFEPFEAALSTDAVEKTPGSVTCSYPQSAIEIPNAVFDEQDFQSGLAQFLSLPDAVDSDLPRPPSACPDYVTALLSGILRGVCRTANVTVISKRIRDNVGKWPRDPDLSNYQGDWRRSPLWLLIRVTIQISAERSSVGRVFYKRFILYFICTLAGDRETASLSNDLLHLMSSKIFRRLRKIGPSTPNWLSKMALRTCAHLREILDVRWKTLSVRSSTFCNPSQEQLARDTRLSLPNGSEYIRKIISTPDLIRHRIPFDPNHPHRGTLKDFLSFSASFFDKAYLADPDITIYGIEHSVEQELDDWIAQVVHVNDACVQLDILMDRYCKKSWRQNPEHDSTKILTMLELFIALDKLGVREIPMLADYPPGIPIAWLEKLCLRKATSLHRLSCIYQYLLARELHSHLGWSGVSDDFTEDSLPIRYYDQSPYLQQLRARIEQEIERAVALGTDQRVGSPLAALPYSKVIVFELQCPPCIRVWRSAIARIYYFVDYGSSLDKTECRPLDEVPGLQSYLVDSEDQGLCRLRLYFYSDRFQNIQTLRYLVYYEGELRNWQRPESLTIGYNREVEPTSLDEYVKFTSHTSNDVLTCQADCIADFSIDEFLAFGHLRSGASLQWLNILHGLRSRTLNLRHKRAHYLLSQAAFQVGPLDLNTAALTWHQELQDTFFCCALIDELNYLFVDGTGLIDWVFMSTISLLLTRILASSPSICVSERAITLLQRVRAKTFSWVQELSYDLQMAPMNDERKRSLLSAAATCRSTFDIDYAALSHPIHSAEDIDAVLSCSLFIQALRTNIYDEHLVLLLDRDSHLRLTLEEVARDAILADPSNRGIDLAIARIFGSYRPGALQIEHLQHPNTRWLICEATATKRLPAQMVHINLLSGQLRVDGQSFGRLPQEICDRLSYDIIPNNDCFAVPSDLPGMDFMSLVVTPNYKLHFSLRDDSLVIRAQCNQTDQVLEYIPSAILDQDLPWALIPNYVHWLDISSGVIEIRPRLYCWEQSIKNWRIECASDSYRAYKGCESLMDIQSPTYAMLLKCFQCLVPNYDILATTSPADTAQSESIKQLSVSLLPWHGLSFFVNDREELESRDFKHMVYDEDQTIQTLFGIDNLLVLRPTTHIAGFSIPEALITRLAIISDGLPHEGGIHFHHYMPYHTFKVDQELGSLVGDGNQKSTRLLAYLHAMTSFHRPDPLTGKIGTQAALDLLLSAGCRSIMQGKALSSDKSSTGSDCISPWSSTKYPQLNAVHDEIQNRYYWNQDSVLDSVKFLGTRAIQRGAHLFPFKMDRPDDLEYVPVIPHSNLELYEAASTLSSAVHCWFARASTIGTISDWMKTWKVILLEDLSASRPHDEPDLEMRTDSDSDLTQMQALASSVHHILEKTVGNCGRFHLLFLLHMTVYAHGLTSRHWQAAVLSILIALTLQTNTHFESDDPFSCLSSELLAGYRPTEEGIRDLIHSSCFKYWLNKEEEAAVDAAVSHLLSDWPLDAPPTIYLDSRVWNTERLMPCLRRLFLSCYRNWNLKEHLMRTLQVTVEPGLPTPTHHLPLAQYASTQHTPLQITLDHLLSNRLPPALPQRSTLLQEGFPGIRKVTTLDDISLLDQLFSLPLTSSRFQQEYLSLLGASANACKESHTTYSGLSSNCCIEALQKHFTKSRTKYMNALKIIKETLGPITDDEKIIEQFSLWPPITADVLLKCLASNSLIQITKQWKRCLISFAQLLLELQRARRLLRFALDGLEEDFSKELENEQCNGWNPEEYPDWLLIQIQGDFLIRRAQAETAMQLMFPQSGGNTVMQVDMGEGKSSVIIPIVAAALADGKQLVRVIVPKALTAQMFDILVTRLGLLTNMPIYHLPFTRTVHNDPYNHLRVETIRDLMSQCMAEHGVLLAQPEHVASLKLMGIERQIGGGNNITKPSLNIHWQKLLSFTGGLLSENSFVGNIFQWLNKRPRLSETGGDSAGGERESDNAAKWLNLGKWVNSHARDILDESDEILHPRFQLIYTIGLEQHMDGYPDRWTITQQILRLVKEHVHTLSRIYSNSVEYEHGPPGSFPRVRFVRTSDVGQQLTSMVVDDVMAGRLHNFNFQTISCAALRDAVRSFVSDQDVLQVSDTVNIVEEYAKHSNQSCLWNGLLLLRGLLSSNILWFALSQRRWRVDYGLSSKPRDHDYTIKPSTMLAVPYRAKDVPAPNTQFGHPDLIIILTCLSYYYAGLTEEQLRVSFEILLDQDDPAGEYLHWVQDHDSLPKSLRDLSNINLRSSEEWDKVTFPLFSRNQAVIDFYLSRVVFPREAKEFPWKLCGSSWDLAERRERLVTGFSGTNDSRWLLPMSIIQHDLEHQRGTSASVLARLLRQEQGRDSENYTVTHQSGQQQTTREFLSLVAIQRPEIRVLLDVGAQILDLSNGQLAEAWLDVVRDAEAAVYFDEDDELTVLPRNGFAHLLASSSFSQRLDKCVVYLDHPHTRGTDLKFPIGSRAAVTLGPKMTKDALVQGCMRMRRLGHGHSVMFFAPPGIDQSIRAVASKQDRDAQITIGDVLSWTIRETWNDIKHSAPYWAQQGIMHQSRYDALSRFCNNDLTREQLSDVWLQPNCRTLVDLYAPRTTHGVQSNLSAVTGLQQRCKDLGILSIPDGKLEEEQEQEVHREREREREVELPPRAVPAEHHLHPDVLSFVKTGSIPSFNSGGAFLPVFTTLERSTATTRDADVWSPSILATVDFSRTIVPESTKGTIDQYLRPVQWVLSGKTDRDPIFVILSPFEADLLMPDIRTSKHVHLHLYAPRTAERMKPSDDLRLYAIPPLPSDWTPPWELVDQLNVFAGQLYLRDYQTYTRLCHFLGVRTDEFPRSSKGKVGRNLFSIPGTFEEMEVTFSDSPLPSVMALLAIRNRGRPFDHTHMGKILQGQILTEKDFKRTPSVVLENA